MNKLFKRFFCVAFILIMQFFSAVHADESDYENLQIKSNGLISESCFKLSGVYPSSSVINSINSFPGNRGPNQLIVYKPSWSERTGTNEFGKEVVVIDDIVVKLTGADSIIPKNGYVISGHGSAKTWINNNVKVGTKIEINEAKNTIRAYTTVDSYKYSAKIKIEEIEDIIKNSKRQNLAFNEKKVQACLKEAKKYLRRAKGDGRSALNNAVQSIKMSDEALRYSLPFVEREVRGIWMRPTEKNVQEVSQTLDNLKSIGINSIFLETYFHGKTIFPSATMEKYGFNRQNPIYGGEDILALYLKEAHKRGIKVHVWFESFYIGNISPAADPKNILYVKPEWGNKNKINADSKEPVWHPTEHKGYFLDPANPQVITFLTELITEISAGYAIDGFNIDYIRYPQAQKSNEAGYEFSNWGYTQYARDEFKSRYGVDPLEIKYKTPMWVEWDKYRQNKINYYIKTVKEILKNREVLISAVIFPDEEISKETKQQSWSDWASFGYIDALTPLILTSDNELSQKMMRNVKKKSAANTKIYPGLFVGFMEGEAEDLLRQIRTMRTMELDGIVLFDYAHLDKKYINCLGSCVFSAICE